jgi:nucleotide-binding universal stress UspA family protein
MESSQPANNGIRVQHILFPTDFSPAADAAFAYAVAIAERYHAKLHVAHVINVEPSGSTDSECSPASIKQAHEQAAQKIHHLLRMRPLSADACDTIVAEGVVSEVLPDMLRRNRIDLAVLGTQGRRALKKLLFGSMAEEILRLAQCPVLTVGPTCASASANVELRRVVYLLQFEPDSSEAAKYAVSLAQRFDANLTVMNVREDATSSAAQQEKREGTTEPFKFWIEDHVPESSRLRDQVHFERGFGPATEAILNFISKAGADLLVMSVERVDPVIAAHLPVPDTAYQLITRAPCPVLTIH